MNTCYAISDIYSKMDAMYQHDLEEDWDSLFQQQRELIEVLSNLNYDKQKKGLFRGKSEEYYLTQHRKFTEKLEIVLEKNMNAYLNRSDQTKKIEKFESLRSYYGAWYDKLVKNEIMLADIKASTRVCCVGVGSLPVSLLKLAKKIKSKITGLDLRENAIVKASEVTKRQQQGHPHTFCDVEYKTLNGCDFDYKNQDVVILATSVFNKDEVIRQIQRTANKNIFIISRTTENIGSYFYLPTIVTLSEAKRIKARRTGIVSSILYQFI